MSVGLHVWGIENGKGCECEFACVGHRKWESV